MRREGGKKEEREERRGEREEYKRLQCSSLKEKVKNKKGFVFLIDSDSFVCPFFSFLIAQVHVSVLLVGSFHEKSFIKHPPKCFGLDLEGEENR